MKKLSAAVLAALVALALTSCELVTATTGSNTNQSAATPSVHGNVILAVSGDPLPAGAMVRVAITPIPSTASLSAPRVAISTVPTGTYHKDIAVSAAGTIAYAITGVPDNSYSVVVTLMNSSSYAIGSTSPVSQTISVTGGASAVSDFTITYSVVQ